MKIEGSDYFVRYVRFPNYAANGMVVSNPDGSSSIYINANLTYEQQLHALEHELWHVEHEDLYRNGDVAEMEADAR